MTRLALVLLGSVSLGRGGNGEGVGVASQAPTSLRFGDREEIHDEALRLLLNAAVAPPSTPSQGRHAHAQFALGELLETSPLLTDRAAALRFYTKAANAAPVRQLRLLLVGDSSLTGVDGSATSWRRGEQRPCATLASVVRSTRPSPAVCTLSRPTQATPTRSMPSVRPI